MKQLGIFLFVFTLISFIPTLVANHLLRKAKVKRKDDQWKP